MQKIYSLQLLISIFLFFIFFSCNKKNEDEFTFIPPNHENIENIKDREEFERLKQMNSQGEIADTVSLNEMSIDTVSLVEKEKKVEKKKEMIRKERELNKRLDNPTETINDYMEYLKRGISEGGNFDKNMEKASGLWESRSTGKFKSYYKNTKKMSVTSEPKVVSQKNNTAVVEVKVKKIDEVNGSDKETVMTVKYNLVADSNGKWKIKSNVVQSN